MRPPALLVLTSLALAAGACSTVEPPAPTPGSLPVSGSAPAAVEGQDWFYSADEQAARLAYGVAESDDLKIGLDCNRASGRLELVTLAEKGARPEIVVESGGDIGRFPALSEPSQLHDGVLLTAAAATDEPVFQRFRRVGWLALWRDGEREAYAPHAGSAADIERFFAFCG